MKHIFNRLLFTFAIVSTAGFCAAQSPEEKARSIKEKYQSALVLVSVKGKLVATTTGEPIPEEDRLLRALGVTVGSNGLIAVSNSVIDTTVGLVGQEVQIGDDVVTVKTAKLEYSEVEISYGDGSVLSGKVVSQDVDTDLAFILPDQEYAKEVNKTFVNVDLSQFAENANMADQIVGLSRASVAFDFMVKLEVGRITNVFRGSPDSYYVTTAGSAPGCPIFTLDGLPVGITVQRIIEGQPTGVYATISAKSIQAKAP